MLYISDTSWGIRLERKNRCLNGQIYYVPLPSFYGISPVNIIVINGMESRLELDGVPPAKKVAISPPIGGSDNPSHGNGTSRHDHGSHSHSNGRHDSRNLQRAAHHKGGYSCHKLRSVNFLFITRNLCNVLCIALLYQLTRVCVCHCVCMCVAKKLQFMLPLF